MPRRGTTNDENSSPKVSRPRRTGLGRDFNPRPSAAQLAGQMGAAEWGTSPDKQKLFSEEKSTPLRGTTKDENVRVRPPPMQRLPHR